MFEIPTGNAARGLGVATLGAERLCPWIPFAGLPVQRDLGKKVTLGTEIFITDQKSCRHRRRDRRPGFQLLFCYGHTAIGQTENSVSGTRLPTVLLLPGFIRDVASAVSVLIPAMHVLRSLVYVVASLTVI